MNFGNGYILALLSWFVCIPRDYRCLHLFLQIFLKRAFKFTSGNTAARNVLSGSYHSALHNMVTDVMNHLSLAQFGFFQIKHYTVKKVQLMKNGKNRQLHLKERDGGRQMIR